MFLGVTVLGHYREKVEEKNNKKRPTRFVCPQAPTARQKNKITHLDKILHLCEAFLYQQFPYCKV